MRARKTMQWLIILFVFGGIASLLWFSAQQGKRNEAEAEALLGPYFAAIAQGRFEDARGAYSEERKQVHSVQQMAAHYRDVQASEGAYKRHNVFAARSAFNLFSWERSVNIDCQIFFRDKLIAVSYIAVRDRAGRLRITSGVSTSGGYARQSLPW